MSEVIEAKPSLIEGLGLFATRACVAGERIHRINALREVTPDAPLRADLGERFDHCDYPDGKVVLIGFPSRHLNHSCDPNAYLDYDWDACYIRARRAISAEEEITIDYNVDISGGTAWPCRCGAGRCLGTVVGDFFLLPQALQIEYQPLLAAWFVRRNALRLTALNALPPN